ncbi:MAG: element excision factor XisI family protein [Anaerolineales bacterium]
MEKLDTYRKYVQAVIKKHAGYKTLYGQSVDTETIFDTARDHYQLVRAGWYNEQRIYGCVMHEVHLPTSHNHGWGRFLAGTPLPSVGGN